MYKKYIKMYTKNIPTNIPTIYQNISKYFQDKSKISKIYKINTKYQAAAGPAQARGRARAGPGPRGPGLGPGLGRAGCRLVFCVYLGYLGYILDISWYIFCYIFWHIFRSILEAEYVGSAALFRTLTYT